MSSSVIEGFPLSPQQRRRWRFGGQARCRLRLLGTCNITALRAALDGVVSRHEILRTRFRTIAGMAYPVQEVHAAASPIFESFDLRGLSAADRETEIQRWEEDLTSRYGERSAPPRYALFQLPREVSVLSLSLPAPCADAAALRNLAREIAHDYGANLTGSPAGEEPAVQYADLAEFFNELVQSEESAAAMALWRRTDFALLGQQSLPFYPVKAPPPDFAPRKVQVAVSAALAAAAAALAEAENISLADFLLALWMILLGRLGRPPLVRRSPVVIGRAFSGRTYEGLEEAVGLFARDLPIQVEVDDRELLPRLLQKVRVAVDEAGQAQDYFDWETVVPADIQERQPCFPHGFEMAPEAESWSTPGVVFEFEQCDAYHDLFELRLRARRRQLEVVYDARNHDASSAGQLVDALLALLESAVANPREAVGSLDPLSARKRHQLLVEWNSAASKRPFVSLHEQFEEQVRRHPGRVAVEGPGRSWSYAELAAATDDLARALVAQGVGPEFLVAVCLERTWEVLVALLGIFKAGGAYLPLDPLSPAARLTAILEDAGARLVLTEKPWHQRLEGAGKEGRVRTMILSELLGVGPPGRHASGPSPRRVDAEGLAYVLYTSGSSGQPKGVMVSHRSLANYMRWVGEALWGAGRSVAVPLVTRPSFDASLKQLFGPLLVGGRVCLLSPEVLDNPLGLLESLAKTRDVVRLNCVPSLWRVLVNALESELAPLPNRRVVAYLGGEALAEDLLRRSFEVFKDLEIWNLSGPTEATANAAATRLREGGPVHLGQPVAGASLFLLDRRLEPVAGGFVGEIFIAGGGLARCYCRRPTATAERFLPDPLNGVAGGRLYRSGDLARFHGDGNLEFVGRLDQQVKLRGYRIELREIETVLRRHPAIAEAAAVVQDTSEGEARLLTFVVPHGQAMPDGQELATFLASQLPEYMVPAYFLTWPELPRTAGGKVDRQQLAAVDPGRYDIREPFVAPRSQIEQQLAEIWCQLLGQGRIGLKDNFYHRGGHSLVAIRMLTEIQKAFGIALSLPVILESGSLEAMAIAIDNACREASR